MQEHLKQFESTMTYDPHSTNARYNRSEDKRILLNQGKRVLPILAERFEYFSQTPITKENTEQYIGLVWLAYDLVDTYELPEPPFSRETPCVKQDASVWKKYCTMMDILVLCRDEESNKGIVAEAAQRGHRVIIFNPDKDAKAELYAILRNPAYNFHVVLMAERLWQPDLDALDVKNMVDEVALYFVGFGLGQNDDTTLLMGLDVSGLWSQSRLQDPDPNQGYVSFMDELEKDYLKKKHKPALSRLYK